jgi:hypothetical protein
MCPQLVGKLKQHDQSILRLIEEGRSGNTSLSPLTAAAPPSPSPSSASAAGDDRPSSPTGRRISSGLSTIAGRFKGRGGRGGGDGDEEVDPSFAPPSIVGELKDEVQFVRHKSFALQVRARSLHVLTCRSVVVRVQLCIHSGGSRALVQR